MRTLLAWLTPPLSGMMSLRFEFLALRLLGVFSLLVPLVLVFRAQHELPYFPLAEDAYYSLTVARNLALGHGVTIDGENLTNGFQPLFTLLCSLVYVLTDGNRLETLRCVIAVSYILFVISAITFGRVVGDASNRNYTTLIFWCSIICYSLSTPILVFSFNGLETGLVLCLTVILGRFMQGRRASTRLHELSTGAVFGLLVLARIDNALFVVSFCLVTLTWQQDKSFASRLSEATTVAVTALLVSTPWWLYNYFYFGSLMPTSGQEQMRFALSGGRILLGAAMGAQNALALVYPSGVFEFSEAVAWILGSLVFVFVVWTLTLRDSDWRDGIRSNASFNRFVLSLLLYCTMLLAWYVLNSKAIHYYPRYFIQYSLIGALSWTLLVQCLARKSRATFIVALTLFSMHAGSLLKNRVYTTRSFYLDQVELIKQHVPHGKKVGALQSGTSGYFLANVVNLDGKVNDKALRLRKAGKLGQYVRGEQIHFLCDWEPLVKEALQGDPMKDQWIRIGGKGNFALFTDLTKQGIGDRAPDKSM